MAGFSTKRVECAFLDGLRTCWRNWIRTWLTSFVGLSLFILTRPRMSVTVSNNGWLLLWKLDFLLNCVASKCLPQFRGSEKLWMENIAGTYCYSFCGGLSLFYLKMKRLIPEHWNSESAEVFILDTGKLRGNLGKFKFTLMSVRSHVCLSMFSENLSIPQVLLIVSQFFL